MGDAAGHGVATVLVDPVDGSRLTFETEPTPALRSTTGRRYPVIGGIPRFVEGSELASDQASTQDTFSRKWDRVAGFGHDAATRDFHHRWYLERYGWGDEEAFAGFLGGCARVLDAGCGVGRDVHWYRQHVPGLVAGVDISTAVNHAAEHVQGAPSTVLAQADIARLPFPEGFFDFIACDQVLHHTVDPRATLHHLVGRVRPGGVIAFYVYRVKGPVREFCDDLLRQRAREMTEQESLALAEAVTRFGRAITEQQLTIEVPESIPELGITAGRFDLQRWIYWTVFKCFYNAEWDWDANVMTNYDWYRPVTAYRYRPEEIRDWIAQEGLDILHEDLGDAGLSYRCRRPAN